MKFLSKFNLGIKKGLKKFNFNGRSTRKELITVCVITPILLIVPMFSIVTVLGALGLEFLMFGFFTIFLFLLLANAIAGIFVFGRRFQDLGVNGLFALPFFFLSPVAYIIMAFFLLLLPSSKNNKYGPNLSNIEINNEDLENFIYYKYFLSNPHHEKMNLQDISTYNFNQAEKYKKLIPLNSLKELEELYSAGKNFTQNIDFSKSMPDLNVFDNKKLVEKYNLENIDLNNLISEFSKNQKNIHFKELEIND